MQVIVGLGNPGEKYKYTRHNAGFVALDAVVAKKGLAWVREDKFDALVCKSDDFLYLKPQTFMNASGKSVAAIVRFYKLLPSDLTVVHDDVDFASGVVKRQFGVGSAGHRGVEDIIEKLGTNAFWRVRIGVGRPLDKRFDVEDWVLEDLEERELKGMVGVTKQYLVK